jgi:ribosomal protein S19E (S16A)
VPPVKSDRLLEAAAPVKRKKVEPFVRVPLWWAKSVAKATRSPAALVMIELLRLRWKTGRSTFPLPNGKLGELGASREVKRRVLRDLERAGLIIVERPPREDTHRDPGKALAKHI